VTGLTSLDLSHNLIAGLSNRVFHNVTGLESLYLQGNRLAEVPPSTFIPLTSLREAYASRHQERIRALSLRISFLPVCSA
jgi:Leucine-rich repeat (LRR) protein